MAELRLPYVLPPPHGGRAVFVTDYGLRGGRLLVDGAEVVTATTREALELGVTAVLEGPQRMVLVRAARDFDVRVWVDGEEAAREDRQRAAARRTAWLHAVLALLASACGFAASWLYVVRARTSGDAWAMKMALHMAGWHLLLTLTLFPAALFGDRIGLITVRVTSLVFFVIHAGIALANLGPEADSGAIAFLNAASGVAFLWTAMARPRLRQPST
jgi:hypothetical protein